MYNTHYPVLEAAISTLTLCHVVQVWVDDDDDQAEALAMVVRTGVVLCCSDTVPHACLKLAVWKLRPVNPYADPATLTCDLLCWLRSIQM